MRLLLAVFISLVGYQALAETTSSSSSSGSAWKFGLGIGYSPNHLVSMKGTVTSSGSTGSLQYDLEYKAAAEASVHVWYVPTNSWGFISGFFYGAERELERGTINGMTIGTTSATSKYQTHFLYLGTVYRWESFYLPFAVTYGAPTFTPADNSEVDSKGGAGALLGLGWFIGDHFAIEYIGRSSATTLKSTSTTSTVDTSGMIASAVLTLKFFY